jgi:uncharacterized protein (TIGR01777 family)
MNAIEISASNNLKKRIILAGGSGFLGGILAKDFLRQGYEIIVLTRTPQTRTDGVLEVLWDAKLPGDWVKYLNGAEVVINLAGKSVDCRYTEKNRSVILASRVDSTRVLGQAIINCQSPPRVWLNSSTATIYKHSLDQPMDEAGKIGATSEAKDKFSIIVAQAWEQAFDDAHTPKTRKVVLRTAMILGADGGVFPVLRRLVRCGLGGKMASGRQFVSWLHETDFCRAIAWLIAEDTASGVFNLAAPNPVPNHEMMKTLRQICDAPFGLPATAWMLEVGAFFLRTETELIIKSRRVVPSRLLASGFEFNYSKLRPALENLCRS